VTGGALAGATLPAAGLVDQKKPVVAGYDLVRAIGRGGMGVVWEAVEHRFDRRVAVKVQQSVLQSAATRDELWAEAFVAARIGDPGIVRVLDVGVTLEEHPALPRAAGSRCCRQPGADSRPRISRPSGWVPSRG